MSQIIMGIQLEKRRETADCVQRLLTEYGCSIRTRLGLHQASEEFCSEKGIIVLEFIPNSEVKALELENKLSACKGVIVRKMVF